MDTSTRAFQIDLYLEHLEEAAFLYEQRKVLRKNAEFSWRAIADFEERLEAHIDALVVGAGLALEICRKRAVEGEPIHTMRGIPSDAGASVGADALRRFIDADRA